MLRKSWSSFCGRCVKLCFAVSAQEAAPPAQGDAVANRLSLLWIGKNPHLATAENFRLPGAAQRRGVGCCRSAQSALNLHSYPLGWL
jgi:hypothetical protein